MTITQVVAPSYVTPSGGSSIRVYPAGTVLDGDLIVCVATTGAVMSALNFNIGGTAPSTLDGSAVGTSILIYQASRIMSGVAGGVVTVTVTMQSQAQNRCAFYLLRATTGFKATPQCVQSTVNNVAGVADIIVDPAFVPDTASSIQITSYRASAAATTMRVAQNGGTKNLPESGSLNRSGFDSLINTSSVSDVVADWQDVTSSARVALMVTYVENVVAPTFVQLVGRSEADGAAGSQTASIATNKIVSLFATVDALDDIPHASISQAQIIKALTGDAVGDSQANGRLTLGPAVQLGGESESVDSDSHALLGFTIPPVKDWSFSAGRPRKNSRAGEPIGP